MAAWILRFLFLENFSFNFPFIWFVALYLHSFFFLLVSDQFALVLQREGVN